MEAITKYKWKYCLIDINCGGIQFKVMPKRNKHVPNTLYKFYPMKNYAVNSLINCRVYAAHPDQFNDLFDCYDGLINFDNEETVYRFLSPIYSRDEVKSLLDKNYPSTIRKVQETFKQIAYKKLGIISMTKDLKNNLLWGYYTDNRGFAVEYDYKSFQFKYHGPFPINYQGKIEPMRNSELANPHNISLGLLYQTNVKTKIWSNEKEWRILVESPEGKRMIHPLNKELNQKGEHRRLFRHSIDAVRSVTLADRFFNPKELNLIGYDMLEVTLIQNISLKSSLLSFLSANKIPTYSVYKNEGSFSLNFKPSLVEKVDDIVFRFTGL